MIMENGKHRHLRRKLRPIGECALADMWSAAKLHEEKDFYVWRNNINGKMLNEIIQVVCGEADLSNYETKSQESV